MTLFGALVELNGLVFWSVGHFLDVTIPQSLIVKLQPRVSVSDEKKRLKFKQSEAFYGI